MTISFDFAGPAVTPRDAATVVLLRDREGGGVELFFVKRRADIRFMGGAYVFPGGKLDPEDSAASLAGDLDADACRERLQEPNNPGARGLFVAAARECLEESGVLLSTSPVDEGTVAALRHALDVEKKPLGPLLEAHDIKLALSALRPLSRWVTPKAETRRFDARFFLARAPRGTVATHDTRETVASLWLDPAEALARAERREIVLVPPTYRTVEELSRARTVDEAMALVPERIAPLEPVVTTSDKGVVIVLPDDAAHPDRASSSTSARHATGAPFVTRFVYDDGLWTAVR